MEKSSYFWWDLWSWVKRLLQKNVDLIAIETNGENALFSDFRELCNVFSTSKRWWCTKIRKRLIEAWIISIPSLSPHLQIKSFSLTWLFWLIGRVLFASFEDCFFTYRSHFVFDPFKCSIKSCSCTNKYVPYWP